MKTFGLFILILSVTPAVAKVTVFTEAKPKDGKLLLMVTNTCQRVEMVPEKECRKINGQKVLFVEVKRTDGAASKECQKVGFRGAELNLKGSRCKAKKILFSDFDGESNLEMPK